MKTLHTFSTNNFTTNIFRWFIRVLAISYLSILFCLFSFNLWDNHDLFQNSIQVFAQSDPDTTFDDQGSMEFFEESFSTEDSLDRWELLLGGWDMWQVLDGRSEAFVQERSSITQISPKLEFWNQLGSNFEYRMTFESLAGEDRNIVFGYRDSNNWYELHFNRTLFNFVSIQDGLLGFNYIQNYTIERQKHDIRIKFLSGKIRIWLDGELLVDVFDNKFSGDAGRIVLRAGTGESFPTKVVFDDLSVYKLDDKQGLGVDVLRQWDLAWSKTRYDQSQTWSDRPTISRWGCALTSMVMIMKYWGYEWVDSDTRLTPESLNEWLDNQPDGYVGQSYINWNAVTRLISWLSDNYVNRSKSLQQLRKLELGRVSHEYAWEEAIYEIESGNPIIMQIDGHFLVADGVVSEVWEQQDTITHTEDFLIDDPAYKYRQFSSHDTDLLSIRTFHPSYTDLSYLSVFIPENVDLEITDDLGQIISTEISVDRIAAWDGDLEQLDFSDQTPALKQVSIKKPATGQYFLKFSSNNPQLTDIKIFAYDDQAEVSIYELSIWVPDVGSYQQGQSPQLQLDFHKDDPSDLVWDGDWQEIEKLLVEGRENKKITKRYVYHQLMLVVSYAKAAGPEKNARYAGLLKIWLEKFAGLVDLSLLLEIEGKLNDF